jgi:rRNA biogenesis protein RRP5
MKFNIFERVTNLEFSTKKMKFLFSKWLEFETENGMISKSKKLKKKQSCS